jgi:hypothetical protein
MILGQEKSKLGTHTGYAVKHFYLKWCLLKLGLWLLAQRIYWQ